MNILDRIEKIANNEGETITSLERIIGASKGVLSRAIAKDTDIQTKWIQNLVENYPQYSSDWLLTGKGSMLRTATLAEPVSTAPQSQNDDIIALLKEQLEKKDKKIEEQAQEIGMLKSDNKKLLEQVMGLDISGKSSTFPSQPQSKDAPSVTAHL